MEKNDFILISIQLRDVPDLVRVISAIKRSYGTRKILSKKRMKCARYLESVLKGVHFFKRCS